MELLLKSEKQDTGMQHFTFIAKVLGKKIFKEKECKKKISKTSV